MNRRGFLTSLFGLALAPLVPAVLKARVAQPPSAVTVDYKELHDEIFSGTSWPTSRGPIIPLPKGYAQQVAPPPFSYEVYFIDKEGNRLA